MLSPYIILVPNLILHIVQYVVTKRKSLKQFITLPILWSHGLASSSSTYHSPSVVYMLMRISDLLSIIPHFLCFVKGENLRFVKLKASVCQVYSKTRFLGLATRRLETLFARCQGWKPKQQQLYILRCPPLSHQFFFKFFLYIVLTIVLFMYYLLY